jgi:2-oxoglutarate ferredoxin oxidoreductase subunit alpha
VPVLAASTPGNCFDMALEAARIALTYRTPVYLLSDAYLANGSEPWLVPDAAAIPEIPVAFATEPNDEGRFLPYVRDDRTLARQWALPGTPGLEHRIGGLEKEERTGNVSYDPDNHELEVDDQEGARLLVLGWGGTYGPIAAAVRRVRRREKAVAHAHLHYLSPFPRNLGDVLSRYERVLVPEMNLGQLLKLVRAEFLVDAVGYNRVRGVPFTSAELAGAIEPLT